MALAERRHLYDLNLARYQDGEQKIQVNSGEEPNKTVYAIIGTAAFLGDLLALIPIVGFIISWPFMFAFGAWKKTTRHNEADFTKKIINNGLARIALMGLANTIFVISAYIEAKKMANKKNE